ncbi:GNAT family N-acetyltransferase [Pseudoalteromonas gelatinilytica]|uniref:N-acetyltransferase n=1 Tax=Pseudoalteromonas gelatinilytica TaxID=1703256 RepID=A0A3A3EJB0_9GAMM|nr:GNAT family N-acetyltransferase [Pseudoalteromonas profundi]RJF35315.1 N-acetyltransferase [Pseudoalteromonas profundi]
MSPSEVLLKESPPTAKDFAILRAAVGWTNPELPIIESSINSSLFWVSVFQSDRLVACGRVIGDGFMYFYVQDVIVHPEFQKLGLGSKIMQSINGFLSSNCHSGTTVGLLAAKGKEDFYLKHGFVLRNGKDLGLGMCRFI